MVQYFLQNPIKSSVDSSKKCLILISVNLFFLTFVHHFFFRYHKHIATNLNYFVNLIIMDDLLLKDEDKTTTNEKKTEKQENDNEVRETEQPNLQRNLVAEANNNEQSLTTDGNITENNNQKNILILHEQMFWESHQSVTTKNRSTKAVGKSSTKALTMADTIGSTREHIRQRNLHSQSGMSDDLQSESVHQNDNHQLSSRSDDGNQRNASNKSGNFSSRYQCVFIICLLLILWTQLAIAVYEYSAISGKDALINKLTNENQKREADNPKIISAKDAIIDKLTNENQKREADNQKIISAKDALIDKLTNENQKREADNPKIISAKDALIDKLTNENQKREADNQKIISAKDAFIDKLTNEN